MDTLQRVSARFALNSLITGSHQLLSPSGACLRLSSLKHMSIIRTRPFTASVQDASWLIPKTQLKGKTRKGRPRMYTGGSVRGTTVVWGDYGLRMKDQDRRISAAQLELGWKAINQRLRGMRYRLYHRIAALTPVYTSGNEVRMGKGKGSFNYWAARVGVSRIIFELRGDIHEQVIRDAFRLAGNKMPGVYEFVKRGDSPVMGVTKMQSEAHRRFLFRPRKESSVAEDIGGCKRMGSDASTAASA